MAHWSVDDIPDQTGRTAVVTGANSGLGLVTARELAKRGAHVVLAVRDAGRGERAAAAVRKAGGQSVEVRDLDLASLASVRSFAEGVDAVDVLVNNAGMMYGPRRETADGFEAQLGTNHLGHFALTGLLLERLQASAHDPRVVTISSIEHRPGKLDFDDLNWERSYSFRPAYQRSKLANLLFALELDRRLRAAGSTVKSVAAHPGYSATNLQTANVPTVAKPFMKVANLVVAQSADRGAEPQLRAATDPDVAGGTYWGPNGPGEMRGRAELASPTKRALDPELAARLWTVSEELTGVSFDLPAPAAA